MPQSPDSLRHLVSVISGGSYSLSLTNIDPTQILYNGKFSYLLNYENPFDGGWCHLLLLRSKNPHSRQLLAIITQTPDCGLSIVNTIEHIATFIMNFFHQFHAPYLREKEDEDDIEAYKMIPESTIFVEYLPTHCFGQNDGHDQDTFAVMRFSWEKVPLGQGNWYYKAKAPETSGWGTDMWRHTRIDTVNDLIERL